MKLSLLLLLLAALVIADDNWRCDDTNCDSEDADEMEGRRHPDWRDDLSYEAKRKCREEWKEFHDDCCWKQGKTKKTWVMYVVIPVVLVAIIVAVVVTFLVIKKRCIAKRTKTSPGLTGTPVTVSQPVTSAPEKLPVPEEYVVCPKAPPAYSTLPSDYPRELILSPPPPYTPI